MKKLFKFKFDCGRMGELNGIFAADQNDIDKVMGEEIYFGEVLGKHSEIVGPLEEGDLTILSEDQEFIKKFEEIVGDIGYNPLDYIEEEGEE